MENKMKAAYLREFHKGLSLEETEIPEPGYGEVLVKVGASGLCASDLHIIDGILPTVKTNYIPGHELAGEIFKLGEGVNDWKIGQHIVASIDVTCNKCRYCLTGKTNLCRSLRRIGFEINGSHAEYAVVPVNNLFKISNSIPFEEAAIIPDAVVCMYHAMKNKGKVTAGDKVLILGVGGLGFQGIQIAKYFGAEVFVTSRQDEKLKLAKEMGADHVINTRSTDIVEEIMELTEGEQCDVIFDNIGISESIDQCLKILRPGGKIVVVGYNDPTFTANYQEIVIREKEIIGIRGSNRQDLVETIKLVEKGIVKPYVYKTYDWADINIALQQMREGKTQGRLVVKY